MAEDLVALTKTRSMLIVLLAAVQQSDQLIVEHATDRELACDLRRMTFRLESELASLTSRLAPAELD